VTQRHMEKMLFARSLFPWVVMIEDRSTAFHDQKMRRVAITCLLAVVISGCFPVGDGGIHAEGKIRDQTDVPIDGALIMFNVSGHERWPVLFETNSKPDGSFQLDSLIAPGNYEIPLAISAKGFKSVTINVPTLARNNVDVKLAPLLSNSESIAVLHTTSY